MPKGKVLPGANICVQEIPVLVEAERECSEKVDCSERSRMDCGWRHQEVLSRSRMASKIKEIQSALMLCHSHKVTKSGHKQTMPRKESGKGK